jgi:PAS domain S-box-containing protein
MLLYVLPVNSKTGLPHFISGDFEAVTGFPYEEVAANPQIWVERVHPEDRDKVVAAVKASASSGRLSIEYRWQCPNGNYRHFLDQSVLVKDADGRPVEFTGTITDITEQRSLESQLVQAQKMDAIGKLTGGIAHDFNNLLAAVIGGLTLLEKKSDLQDDQKRLLVMTKRAAEQGSDLVRRLLAFARRQKLEPKRIQLDALRQAVADLLTHTLGGLVKIDWDIEDGVCDAFADQAQLELALVNLIINARDAMPNGGTVVVRARDAVLAQDSETLPAGEFIRIAVCDTGTGIPPDAIEKVMDPFFTTKEVGKGSGLGLSMVYGFAKQSNGAFTIESEVGSGTTAELWLPRAPEGSAEARQAAPPEPSAHATKPLRILLVDDHAQVRNTTAALLEDQGHTVTEASNGAEALKLLKKHDCEFDALISDYAMPQLSGTDFLKEAYKLCPDLPALIVTGYAEAEAIGERPEGVAILQKPFTPAALQDAVERLAELSGSTTSN